MLYYVMLYYITSYYLMLHYDMLCYATSCYDLSHRVSKIRHYLTAKCTYTRFKHFRTTGTATTRTTATVTATFTFFLPYFNSIPSFLFLSLSLSFSPSLSLSLSLSLSHSSSVRRHSNWLGKISNTAHSIWLYNGRDNLRHITVSDLRGSSHYWVRRTPSIPLLKLSLVLQVNIRGNLCIGYMLSVR